MSIPREYKREDEGEVVKVVGVFCYVFLGEVPVLSSWLLSCQVA